MKKSYRITVDGQELRLRLTTAGIRQIHEESGRNPREVLLEAIDSAESMAVVLTAALNWKGNENPIRDGEALYDLLVDDGWAGSADFGKLIFALGAVSGLWSSEDGDRMFSAMQRAVEDAYSSMEGIGEQPDDPSSQRGSAPSTKH